MFTHRSCCCDGCSDKPCDGNEFLYEYSEHLLYDDPPCTYDSEVTINNHCNPGCQYQQNFLGYPINTCHMTGDNFPVCAIGKTSFTKVPGEETPAPMDNGTDLSIGKISNDDCLPSPNKHHYQFASPMGQLPWAPQVFEDWIMNWGSPLIPVGDCTMHCTNDNINSHYLAFVGNVGTWYDNDGDCTKLVSTVPPEPEDDFSNWQWIRQWVQYGGKLVVMGESKSCLQNSLKLHESESEFIDGEIISERLKLFAEFCAEQGSNPVPITGPSEFFKFGTEEINEFDGETPCCQKTSKTYQTVTGFEPGFTADGTKLPIHFQSDGAFGLIPIKKGKSLVGGCDTNECSVVYKINGAGAVVVVYDSDVWGISVSQRPIEHYENIDNDLSPEENKLKACNNDFWKFLCMGDAFEKQEGSVTLPRFEWSNWHFWDNFLAENHGAGGGNCLPTSSCCQPNGVCEDLNFWQCNHLVGEWGYEWGYECELCNDDGFDNVICCNRDCEGTICTPYELGVCCDCSEGVGYRSGQSILPPHPEHLWDEETYNQYKLAFFGDENINKSKDEFGEERSHVDTESCNSYGGFCTNDSDCPYGLCCRDGDWNNTGWMNSGCLSCGGVDLRRFCGSDCEGSCGTRNCNDSLLCIGNSNGDGFCWGPWEFGPYCDIDDCNNFANGTYSCVAIDDDSCDSGTSYVLRDTRLGACCLLETSEYPNHCELLTETDCRWGENMPPMGNWFGPNSKCEDYEFGIDWEDEDFPRPYCCSRQAPECYEDDDCDDGFECGYHGSTPFEGHCVKIEPPHYLYCVGNIANAEQPQCSSYSDSCHCSGNDSGFGNPGACECCPNLLDDLCVPDGQGFPHPGCWDEGMFCDVPDTCYLCHGAREWYPDHICEPICGPGGCYYPIDPFRMGGHCDDDLGCSVAYGHSELGYCNWIHGKSGIDDGCGCFHKQRCEDFVEWEGSGNYNCLPFMWYSDRTCLSITEQQCSLQGGLFVGISTDCTSYVGCDDPWRHFTCWGGPCSPESFLKTDCNGNCFPSFVFERMLDDGVCDLGQRDPSSFDCSYWEGIDLSPHSIDGHDFALKYLCSCEGHIACEEWDDDVFDSMSGGINLNCVEFGCNDCEEVGCNLNGACLFSERMCDDLLGGGEKQVFAVNDIRSGACCHCDGSCDEIPRLDCERHPLRSRFHGPDTTCSEEICTHYGPVQHADCWPHTCGENPYGENVDTSDGCLCPCLPWRQGTAGLSCPEGQCCILEPRGYYDNTWHCLPCPCEEDGDCPEGECCESTSFYNECRECTEGCDDIPYTGNCDVQYCDSYEDCDAPWDTCCDHPNGIGCHGSYGQCNRNANYCGGVCATDLCGVCCVTDVDCSSVGYCTEPNTSFCIHDITEKECECEFREYGSTKWQQMSNGYVRVDDRENCYDDNDCPNVSDPVDGQYGPTCCNLISNHCEVCSGNACGQQWGEICYGSMPCADVRIAGTDINMECRDDISDDNNPSVCWWDKGEGRNAHCECDPEEEFCEGDCTFGFSCHCDEYHLCHCLHYEDIRICESDCDDLTFKDYSCEYDCEFPDCDDTLYHIHEECMENGEPTLKRYKLKYETIGACCSGEECEEVSETDCSGRWYGPHSRCQDVDGCCFPPQNYEFPEDSQDVCCNLGCCKSACFSADDCPWNLCCIDGECDDCPPDCILHSDCPEGECCIDSSCEECPCHCDCLDLYSNPVMYEYECCQRTDGVGIWKNVSDKGACCYPITDILPWVWECIYTTEIDCTTNYGSSPQITWHLGVFCEDLECDSTTPDGSVCDYCDTCPQY